MRTTGVFNRPTTRADLDSFNMFLIILVTHKMLLFFAQLFHMLDYNQLFITYI